MKKKFRDIVVNDIEYAWSVQEKRWPYAGLRIWSKSRGKIPLCELDFIPAEEVMTCLLYTSPSPRDATLSRMPSSA